MAFYCCARLPNKLAFTSFNRLPTILGKVNYAQAAAGVPKITFKKFEESNVEHYDDKNNRLLRPLSPHLTIYSPQLTSMLSITHRITGMMLTGYFTVLGVGALALPNDVSHYITMIEGLNMSPATLFLAKVVLAAPFGYHLANGLRHLYWDTARGLTINEVYKTGYFMLATASLITLGLAAL